MDFWIKMQIEDRVVPIQKVVYIKGFLLKTQGKICCCCCLSKFCWFVHLLDGTINSCIKSQRVMVCEKPGKLYHLSTIFKYV